MANCNCGPQSHFAEWSTSPVRHSLCIRTSTGSSCDGHDARRGLDADAAERQRQVRLLIDHRRVGEQVEHAEVGGQLQGDFALDELLAPPAVFDQVGDGAHLQPVPLAETAQVGQAGHRAVFVEHLADDRDLAQAPRAGTDRRSPRCGRPGPARRRAGR